MHTHIINYRSHSGSRFGLSLVGDSGWGPPFLSSSSMGEGKMQSVSFQDQPAVADDDEATERPTTVAEKEQHRLAPQTPVEGTPQRGPSSKHNQEWDLDFGMFLGYWGTRGTREIRERMERQILKSPAMMQVVIEATAGIEELLRRPPVAGSAVAGLDGRSTYEHWVSRGNEESAVLIAVRKGGTVRI